MRRMLAIGMLGLVLALGTTGCSSDLVCPAIGWNNTVQVDASAFGDAVLVQLCVDAGCSAGPGEEPAPSSDMGMPVHAEDGVFNLSMTAPEEATIRVYDAAGTLLQESGHEIEWTHSTEACGGPGVAAPITVIPERPS
ncbi:hypothetical protein [Microbacterium murale]|uniref:Lipoprotein n=1 Tax=Microbacterium murale TaxID=1081040 RepID=A0ABU0P447_9MICO|nr:hypothetical protein [Microbacterium murale]MDQ0642111.1 hypothetical protein [Microbacterium murale]